MFGLFLTSALLLGSPGPAPLSLAACGASFGVNKSLGYLSGLILGLSCVTIGAALGISALFENFPSLRLMVQSCGAAYILYIAFKIATAPIKDSRKVEGENKIPSLVDGVILNLLNPKAYAVLLAIFAQTELLVENVVLNFLLMAIVCLSAATIVDFLWLLMGRGLKALFENPKTARPLRVSFALLMIVVVAYSLRDEMFS